MFIAFNGSRKLSLVLVTFLLGSLAAPANGDEAKFLPDGEHLLLSFRMPTFLKSKIFAEVKKKSEKAAQNIAAVFEGNLGVASDNIDRIIVGMTVPKSGVGKNLIAVTIKKPVTFENIKAKLASGARDYDWKETKVAGFTIHQIGDNPDPAQTWQPFCIAEEKVLLNGTLASLKKILQRNKAPNLAAGMRTGLKEAGHDNALSIVFDLQRLMAEREENKLPGDLVPFPVEALKGVNVLAFKANETDQFTATATFFCKDAAATAAVEQMIDLFRSLIKNASADPGNLAEPFKERAKAMLTMVNAVKVSKADNRVTATLTVEPSVVASQLHSIFAPPPNPAPKANRRQDRN